MQLIILTLPTNIPLQQFNILILMVVSLTMLSIRPPTLPKEALPTE
jgi:hypothetical protein